MAEPKRKNLTAKQKLALALLTCGEGLSYKEIAERVNVTPKTLWEWRNSNDFVTFQEELQRLNDERWQATVDAARKSALKLVQSGNQRMVEFVLKNEGYNPTQHIDADVNVPTTIKVSLED